jgi:hypothetical protein
LPPRAGLQRTGPRCAALLSRFFPLQKSPQPLVDFGRIPSPCHSSVVQIFDGLNDLGDRFLDLRQLLFELAIHRPSQHRLALSIGAPARSPGQLANPVWFD